MNYEYDWDKIPTGSTFTADIGGIKCTGRVLKEGKKIYLCQDRQSGDRGKILLGYKYSWTIKQGSLDDLELTEVDELRVFLPEKGYKIPIDLKSFGSYDVSINKNFVRVGCTPVSFEQVEAVYLKMKSLRK